MIEYLPTTQTERKWSFIYAYNLKTLRDIFVYSSLKREIREEQLYKDMAQNIIPPPNKQWVNQAIERKERLRLEYIHAAEYLKLIKRNQGTITANLDNFNTEKKVIIEANKGRTFKPSLTSIDLKPDEKWALTNIVFDYERAKDYLSWYLTPKKKRKGKNSFKLSDFRKEGKPIFLSGKTISNKKGADILRRGADGKLWKIPENYIRLANSLFPSWFTELGIIDKVTVFPEFSDDRKLWHMLYPIKISNEDFLNKDIGKLLEDLFLKDSDKKSIWLPQLIYSIALKYGCSTLAIKRGLEKVYKEDYEHCYLERTSLSLMKRHSQYEGSYVKVDGFFRSNLILTRRSKENG